MFDDDILPPHERLVHRRSQVEDVIADGQVVLQPEGLQDDAVPHWEGQPQLLVVVGCVGGERTLSDPRHRRHLADKRLRRSLVPCHPMAYLEGAEER